MSESISWETSMDAALSRADKEKKLALLDFYNPG